MARRFTRRFSRRALSLRPVNSIKNYVAVNGSLTGTLAESDLVVAQDDPQTSVTTDVRRGCAVKAIYLIVDVCGLAGTGVLNVADFYLWKNPGNNLTPPGVLVWSGSNEKKFIFKTWSFMIMRNQDGNMPFHWEGWIPIPKIYQRMGTDDTISLVSACTAAVTGHISIRCLYKWYM